MILSHDRKFVFIKTFKTAGSSLEIVLAKYCGPDDILTPLDPDEEKTRHDRFGAGARNYRKKFRDMSKREILKTVLGLGRPSKFFEHSSACQVKELIGENVWAEYFTFTIVRNPFDRALSRFHYSRHFDYEHVRRTRWGGYTRSDPDDLDQFLRYHPDLINENWCMYTERDQVLVDFCVRYEHLEADLAIVSRRIGLGRNLFDDLVDTRAKANFRPAGEKCQKLDEAQRAVVRHLCRPEIELFGYESGAAAST